FGNSRQINQISHLLTEHGTLRDLKIRSGLRGIPKQIPYLQPIMEEEDFTDFIQTYIPNRKKGNYHRKHCTKLRRTIMLAGLIHIMTLSRKREFLLRNTGAMEK